MSVELERAVLTTNSRVWVPIGADENRFPSFSGTGYAMFPAYKVMSHCFILFFVLFVLLQLYEVFFLASTIVGWCNTAKTLINVTKSFSLWRLNMLSLTPVIANKKLSKGKPSNGDSSLSVFNQNKKVEKIY